MRIGHSGGTTVLEIPEIIFRVSENCIQDNPCNGNKCPKHSDCIPSWNNYTCKCHTGNVKQLLLQKLPVIDCKCYNI